MKILDVPQSGSQGGLTSSRNRYGQYRRARAIPVNPNTPAQGQARARMSANSADWRTLTDAQRAGWSSLGESMTRADALGQIYTLTGFQAFCSVNGNLLNIGGAVLTAAPALVTPAALTSASVTTTAGTLSLIFAASPLDAGAKLLVFAGPGRSAGRGFEGDYRLVHVSTAAQATPANILSDYTIKYGAPVVGLKIFFSIQVSVGGFVSGPIIISKVVTA